MSALFRLLLLNNLVGLIVQFHHHQLFSDINVLAFFSEAFENRFFANDFLPFAFIKSLNLLRVIPILVFPAFYIILANYNII
jgi:hypothetical protein